MNRAIAEAIVFEMDPEAEFVYATGATHQSFRWIFTDGTGARRLAVYEDEVRIWINCNHPSTSFIRTSKPYVFNLCDPNMLEKMKERWHGSPNSS